MLAVDQAASTVSSAHSGGRSSGLWSSTGRARPAVDPTSLVTLPAPVCQVDSDLIRVEVLTVITSGTWRWPPGQQARCRCASAGPLPTWAEGELVALVDSAGHLSVAQRAGSAARCTGLQAGAVVELITTPIDDPVT